MSWGGLLINKRNEVGLKWNGGRGSQTISAGRILRSNSAWHRERRQDIGFKLAEIASRPVPLGTGGDETFVRPQRDFGAEGADGLHSRFSSLRRRSRGKRTGNC